MTKEEYRETKASTAFIAPTGALVADARKRALHFKTKTGADRLPQVLRAGGGQRCAARVFSVLCKCVVQHVTSAAQHFKPNKYQTAKPNQRPSLTRPSSTRCAARATPASPSWGSSRWPP